MSRQIVTTLIDDIDGSQGEESIAFAYRGTSYSIDLNAKNAAAFDKAMAKFLEHATRESARRDGPRTTRPAPTDARRTDLADIRVWAGQHGYEVSSRGRIPGGVVDAYDAAH